MLVSWFVPAYASGNIKVSKLNVQSNISVSGQVSDERGQPMPGVSIKLIGTNIGTVADANGKYSLSVPDSQVSGKLQFTFIGYVKQEVAIEGKLVINVTLQPEPNNVLNEVVVVGYGTQKRATVNGSVNTVGAKDIGDKPVLNAFQALQGESPNLIIQQPTLDLVPT